MRRGLSPPGVAAPVGVGAGFRGGCLLPTFAYLMVSYFPAPGLGFASRQGEGEGMISLRRKQRLVRLWRRIEIQFTLVLALAFAFVLGWLIARLTAF